MSMGETWRPRFAALELELRDHTWIDVTAFEVRPPAGAADLDAAAAAAGGSLPDALAAFYGEMDGARVEWCLRDEHAVEDGGVDRGCVDLLPLAEVFKDWNGVTWFDDDDRYRGVRPLDFFAPEACAALVCDEGTGLMSAVHYHYLGELLCDTGHGFGDFLDRLLVARGFWYWIESLCPRVCTSPEAQRFLQRMPDLFADFDAALFAPAS
jgi:hypothetical protein